MGLLDIDNLTIGYSSIVQNNCIETLNTKVITETETLITSGINDIKASLRSGWQGDACDAYILKLEQTGQHLVETLSKMRDIFESSFALEEESCQNQEVKMVQSFETIDVFGGC